MSKDVCSFCGSQITIHWEPARVWRCDGCGLMMKHPMPSDGELSRLYEEGWDEPEAHRRETGGTDAELGRTYARRLAGSLGRTNLAGLSILDFGAGRGDLLAALAELGADVCGVEPFGWEFVESRGFTVYRKLEDIPPDRRFDGAVSMDVVEHLRTPWIEMAALRRVLRSGGWLHVSTPNCDGARARLKGARWEEALKPGHLVLFTSRGLLSVLNHCGYERPRRLRWFIPYRRGVIGTAVNYLLQALHLDGALRFLAWNP